MLYTNQPTNQHSPFSNIIFNLALVWWWTLGSRRKRNSWLQKISLLDRAFAKIPAGKTCLNDLSLKGIIVQLFSTSHLLSDLWGAGSQPSSNPADGRSHPRSAGSSPGLFIDRVIMILHFFHLWHLLNLIHLRIRIVVVMLTLAYLMSCKKAWLLSTSFFCLKTVHHSIHLRLSALHTLPLH